MRNIFDFFRRRPKMQALKSPTAGDRQIVRRPYLLNAISLQMVKIDGPYVMEVTPVKRVPHNCISAIGHADLASVMGVPCNRIAIALNNGDEAYVAQAFGGRLPEGATTLPKGVSLRFFRVTIRKKP
jgi:hypothetical protein